MSLHRVWVASLLGGFLIASPLVGKAAWDVESSGPHGIDKSAPAASAPADKTQARSLAPKASTAFSREFVPGTKAPVAQGSGVSYGDWKVPARPGPTGSGSGELLAAPTD